jgi:hypothetical protein
MSMRRVAAMPGVLVALLAIALTPSSTVAAPNGCSTGTPAYGVGISITPEFVGGDDLAVAAYPGEQVDYDVTVFLRAEPGEVIVCPIHDGTVTATLPNGAGPFTIVTGLSLDIGQSITFSNVPATKYAVNEADVVPGGVRRVEAKATVEATSDGPDDGSADDAPVTATAVAPTFLLAPSTQLSVTADRTVIPSGAAVVWTVVERNDTPAGYFPAGLTAPRVELSTDGGAASFASLTASSPGMTGDDGNGVLNVGEAWTWTVTTNPVQDATVTATGFGTGPRARVITFPTDPDERAAASVDVINPSTVVGISAGAAPSVAVVPGSSVTWTVTERNDGDVALTAPFVRLDSDGGDDGDLATLSTPPASGDGDTDGVLDPGETWTWSFTTNPVGDVTVTATGHGVDPLGRDITFPADPDERAAASVTILESRLPPTGVRRSTTSIASAGFVLLLGGTALRLLSRARPPSA